MKLFLIVVIVVLAAAAWYVLQPLAGTSSGSWFTPATTPTAIPLASVISKDPILNLSFRFQPLPDTPADRCSTRLSESPVAPSERYRLYENDFLTIAVYDRYTSLTDFLAVLDQSLRSVDTSYTSQMTDDQDLSTLYTFEPLTLPRADEAQFVSGLQMGQNWPGNQVSPFDLPTLLIRKQQRILLVKPKPNEYAELSSQSQPCLDRASFAALVKTFEFYY